MKTNTAECVHMLSASDVDQLNMFVGIMSGPNFNNQLIHTRYFWIMASESELSKIGQISLVYFLNMNCFHLVFPKLYKQFVGANI